MIPLPVSTLALVTWSAASAAAFCVTLCVMPNGSVAPRDGPAGRGRWTNVLGGSTSLPTRGYEPGGRPVLADPCGGRHAEACHRGGLRDVRRVDRVGSADLRGEQPDRTAGGQVGEGVHEGVDEVPVVAAPPQHDRVDHVSVVAVDHVAVDGVLDLDAYLVVDVVVPAELLDHGPGAEPHARSGVAGVRAARGRAQLELLVPHRPSLT